MAALTIDSTFKLKSGYEMPRLGFGVYQTPAADTEKACSEAIAAGYRHIDSAAAYRNEAACADAIRASGLPRSALFFTSKIPPKVRTYEGARAVIAETLRATGLGYVDLYLIHAPFGGYPARKALWAALADAVRDGQVRSVGVSNFGVDHLDELERRIIPELEAERGGGSGSGGTLSVNQCEVHPWCARADVAAWCAARGVALQAFCPIVRGSRLGGREPELARLAVAHGRSEAQVLLRWSLQKGFVPVVKSADPARIRENADLFAPGFHLAPADLAALETAEYSPVAWDPTRSGLDN